MVGYRDFPLLLAGRPWLGFLDEDDEDASLRSDEAVSLAKVYSPGLICVDCITFYKCLSQPVITQPQPEGEDATPKEYLLCPRLNGGL
jgi:hypothetical protein